MNISEKKAVDLLVNEFWRMGYFTVSRRFGIYLPEPSSIGRFKVDVIGRQKDKYAIGLFLTKEEIFKADLLEKISYLASRKTKFSDRPIMLLIGVPDKYFKQVKELLTNVDEKVRKNIKLTRIIEENLKCIRNLRQPEKMIFS